LAGASVPILVGPTAVGKTAVALALGEHLDLEVVSADSRQAYRRLDIGTAKPTPRERRRVAHHGVDVVEPGRRYSAGRFAADGAQWIKEIRARGRLPVVVGGTGLYVRALAEGLFREPPLDPARRAALEGWVAQLADADLLRWVSRLDPEFRGGGRQRAQRALELVLLTGHPVGYWHRVARASGVVSPWYVVLTAPRPVLHRRIRQRAEEMVRRGMIEEVAAVLAEGHPPDAPGLNAVGVREAVEYHLGRRPRDTVAEAAAASTRQYAKRQETWFRHQLRGPVLALDAARPPAELAAEIARAWSSTPRGGAPPLLRSLST
jgi:tRNA dimethylallyltransferase